MADFLDVFDTKYAPHLAARAPTFRAVLREAIIRCAMNVVETGSVRKADNWEGDGQSTVILNDYMRYQHGRFSTIDIDQEATDLSAKVAPETHCYCQDSVVWLNNNKSAIDLLYLDSFDLDPSNAHPAALHCLFEFTAALPQLHPGSIVFIDDSPVSPDWQITGKGTYVAQYMKHLGIRPFTFGYQAAWIMK